MNAIEVKNVKKKFRVFFDKSYSLKERIIFRKRNHYEDRWVLQGISFEVKKGEAIGIVGANGCGKSTLLKLLTRIYYPDTGEVNISGRVSSLIELGAGFHPDMSGRENIYTNASIFGLSREEIDDRLGSIIDFSELQDFIDNPVRTYSSGMYMRLAFSVAIHVDADVLLIDEILAVGDASFQAKCFNKLREIKAKGTTIVIVSHSLGQIEQICERSMWIHEGKIQMLGNPRDVHPEYLDYMGEKQNNKDVQLKSLIKKQIQKPKTKRQEIDVDAIVEDEYRWGNKDAYITSVLLKDGAGNNNLHHKTGDYLEIEIHYETRKKVKDPNIGIQVIRNDGIAAYGTTTKIDSKDFPFIEGEGFVKFIVKENSLLPGEYKLNVAIEDGDGFPCDYIRECRTFVMFSPIQDIGISRIFHDWEFYNEN